MEGSTCARALTLLLLGCFSLDRNTSMFLLLFPGDAGDCSDAAAAMEAGAAAPSCGWAEAAASLGVALSSGVLPPPERKLVTPLGTLLSADRPLQAASHAGRGRGGCRGDGGVVDGTCRLRSLTI